MNASNGQNKVIGVVLAGGRSSRMGQDKALLKIETQSMLSRSAQMLADAGVDKVVISRNDGAPGHISDIISDKGPLSGIHSAAVRFANYNLLIMPVDLPLMNAQTLQALITRGLQSKRNVRYQNDNLPLFIHNFAMVRQVLDYTLKCTNCFSVEGFCSHFPMAEIKQGLATTMLNTNTPSQWQIAMQHLNSKLTNHTLEHA